MTSDVIADRMTADVDGSFVVFRIGMRINRLWKVHTWLPVFLAMPRMLRELEADPDSGLLGYSFDPGIRNQTLLMYWRSFDDLHGYARDAERAHLPAWDDFTDRVGSNGDVGIWHETFLVRSGEYEAVYNNMPPVGLGEFSELVPATEGRRTAVERLGRTEDGDVPDAVAE